jgi:hypothetical protein
VPPPGFEPICNQNRIFRITIDIRERSIGQETVSITWPEFVVDDDEAHDNDHDDDDNANYQNDDEDSHYD